MTRQRSSPNLEATTEITLERNTLFEIRKCLTGFSQNFRIYAFTHLPSPPHTSTVAAETRRILPAKNTDGGTRGVGAEECGEAIMDTETGGGIARVRSAGDVMKMPYAKRNVSHVASTMLIF